MSGDGSIMGMIASKCFNRTNTQIPVAARGSQTYVLKCLPIPKLLLTLCAFSSFPSPPSLPPPHPPLHTGGITEKLTLLFVCSYRRYRNCWWFFGWHCGPWKYEYDRELYYHMGWGGSSNGWRKAKAFSAFAARK